MTVQQLLQDLPVTQMTEVAGEVKGIALDSREVEPGDLFVALKGNQENGLGFIQDALSRGAVGVISEVPWSQEGVETVVLPQVRDWLGTLASRVYGDPSLGMKVVGITGTNGKTTITYLLESILRTAGNLPGVIGTINYRWGGVEEAAFHTTPEAPRLHKTLRRMLDDQVSHVVVECSSHALSYGRIANLNLDVALFTNLTQDHLDFHGSFENYKQAKWKLFDEILTRSQKANRGAVVNVDDPLGAQWAHEIPFPVSTYSLRNTHAAVHATDVSLSVGGITATVKTPSGRIQLESPLVGEHNLSNLLAAVAVAGVLEIPHKEIEQGLNSLARIPGRLERIENELGLSVLVDYAHTEDALKNVLRAVRPLTQGRVVVVFGCGGDRDRGKRPEMMRAACEGADVVVLTSDNPRKEDPTRIMDDAFRGKPDSFVEVEAESLSPTSKNCVSRMVSRKEAIAAALNSIQAGDLVLIAGKGHETYQEIDGVRRDFDDREMARECLKRRRS